MGKGKFDAARYQKKLLATTPAPDSIQAVSQLSFQNKEHSTECVRIWEQSFKAGTIDQRLTLLYIANEILQTCKRKDALMFKDSFRSVLPRLLPLFNGSSFVDKVVRVLEVWVDRKVYEAEFCRDMKEKLHVQMSLATSGTSIEDTKIDYKLLEDFEAASVVDALKRFIILETEIASKQRQLNLVGLDVTSTEGIRKLKDRVHGEQFRLQFEDACSRLEDYVQGLEREVAEREKLLALLEKSHMFYAAQYSDVNVVVTAYKKYGQMVAYMKKKVEDKLLDLPDDEIPRDVPSPQGSEGEDFATEVAVLSRKEEDMDIEAEEHRRHEDKSSSSGKKKKKHKKQKHKHNKHSKKRSRSRSRSRGSRSRTSSNTRSGTPEKHEMAIGSDSPPHRNSFQAKDVDLRTILNNAKGRSERAGTPTQDEPNSPHVRNKNLSARGPVAGYGNSASYSQPQASTPNTALNTITSFVGLNRAPPSSVVIPVQHQQPQQTPPQTPVSGWMNWSMEQKQQMMQQPSPQQMTHQMQQQPPRMPSMQQQTAVPSQPLLQSPQAHMTHQQQQPMMNQQQPQSGIMNHQQQPMGSHHQQQQHMSQPPPMNHQMSHQQPQHMQSNQQMMPPQQQHMLPGNRPALPPPPPFFLPPNFGGAQNSQNTTAQHTPRPMSYVQRPNQQQQVPANKSNIISLTNNNQDFSGSGDSDFRPFRLQTPTQGSYPHGAQSLQHRAPQAFQEENNQIRPQWRPPRR